MCRLCFLVCWSSFCVLSVVLASGTLAIKIEFPEMEMSPSAFTCSVQLRYCKIYHLSAARYFEPSHWRRFVSSLIEWRCFHSLRPILNLFGVPADIDTQMTLPTCSKNWDGTFGAERGLVCLALACGSSFKKFYPKLPLLSWRFQPVPEAFRGRVRYIWYWFSLWSTAFFRWLPESAPLIKFDLS